MRARRALLDPADVQSGRSEVHLTPGIPVAVTVALNRFDEPLNLGLGKMLSGPQVAVL
jgi:hypothetical protein